MLWEPCRKYFFAANQCLLSCYLYLDGLGHENQSLQNIIAEKIAK